mmetsp:Transcript_24253/g.47499  ORF Transcript_24253/g.47499 Transcript_24253/m.47499 type:complete len:222 (+) Transcript_24253:458-1123(+)
MFSGLLARSSRDISIWNSLSRAAGSTSSMDTYSTSGLAATCMARESARSVNFSPRATKSVSQLSSRRTPILDPGWMYCTTRPSAAVRPAFLAAPAIPFFLRKSSAAWTSLLDSARAFLQSIIPAPVLSRRAFTALALTATLGFSAEASAAGASSFFSSFFSSACFCIAAVCSSTSLARSPTFFSIPSPRMNLWNRRILMFSPSLEIASTRAWLTVLVGSMM